MKALTLWQPWASAMAAGVKTIETRGWRMSYRGELVIHAAKKNDPRLVRMALDTWPEEALLRIGDELPRGRLLAVVNLVDVIPTEEARERFPDQVPFGDFADGRFAWICENVRPLAHAVEWSGHQGLWNVPEDLERQLTELVT